MEHNQRNNDFEDGSDFTNRVVIAAEAGSPGKMFEQPYPFAGRSAVLVTMHGKEKAVAPAFGQVLGIKLVVTKGVGTDALGTFSGETARRGRCSRPQWRRPGWESMRPDCSSRSPARAASVPTP